MVSVAEPEPTAFGANAIWMTQLAPCVIPDPIGQLLLMMEKSASPLMARLLICNGPVPVLFTVTICDGLCVPNAWLPKFTADGVTEAVAGLTPVPDSDTEAAPFEASLPM